MHFPKGESLLTFGEAAKLLNVSLRQFRRLVDSGKIPIVGVSERAPRVSPTAMQEFVAKATVQRSPGGGI